MHLLKNSGQFLGKQTLIFCKKFWQNKLGELVDYPSKVVRFLMTAGFVICTFSGGSLAQETLRIGMTPEPYMPFTRVNSAGEWEGLEADLSRALCEKMPTVTCSFEQMAWEGLMPSLLAGKVDTIIGAFSITEERLKTVRFSHPYYNEATSLVGAKADSRDITITRAEDDSGDMIVSDTLDGSIIGVQVSSTQFNYVQKYLPNVEVKAYDTADNAMADLMAGRVDYVLAADFFIRGYLDAQKDQDHEIKVDTLKNKIFGQGVGYPVRMDDQVTLDRINVALEQLEEDGTLQRLVDRWMLKDS